MPEPYKTLIIEDEEPARERLKRLLAHTDDVKLIGEAGDGEEGLKLIEGLRQIWYSWTLKCRFTMPLKC